jgi:SNF2 family DNA or RNA helicase
LTGTPIENDLEELRALFDFVMPGFLGDAQGFRERYRLPIERDGDPERLRTLRARVGPFVLRRLKEEVARELPSKSTIVRPIDLDGAQRDLYESIRVAAHAKVRAIVRAKGLARATVDVLAALTKLRQVCCDPRLLPFDGSGAPAPSAKLEALLHMLEQLVPQGRRVLVFSQFTSMLALIAEELRTRRTPYLVLTGETSDRMGAIDAFERGDADVFLISLKAGGTGLNLVGADTVIHYDPWWNPAAKRQATDRAHRIGQDKPVIEYELIAAGSVEERILRMQSRKQALADAVLSGKGSGAGVFTMADVDDLFAPLEDLSPSADPSGRS